MNAYPEPHYRHILVPTEYQPESQAAYQLALASASSDTVVTLLHVLPPFIQEEYRDLNAIRLMYLAADQRRDVWRRNFETDNRDVARHMERLQSEVPDTWKQHTEIRYAIRRGDLGTEIANFANEHQVDLIVLPGSRPGILPTLKRSLSRQLAKLTPAKIIQVTPPLPVG
jgi:nucleotide-binding universal stress UspA family protein